MVERRKIVKPPVQRRWVECPICGTKLAIADNTTVCRGLYIKCKRCKKEIKIEL